MLYGLRFLLLSLAEPPTAVIPYHLVKLWSPVHQMNFFRLSITLNKLLKRWRIILDTNSYVMWCQLLVIGEFLLTGKFVIICSNLLSVYKCGVKVCVLFFIYKTSKHPKQFGILQTCLCFFNIYLETKSYFLSVVCDRAPKIFGIFSCYTFCLQAHSTVFA